ncbi:2-amino-4-hydroxy-6-hydroxymethyldihydropteridine diphosphokinase [Marinilabilia rubra]|uniref:2-amino-4-hydroxy-6-hydroxymethyldihydropteridine pyrophosphokinase n=1 Tax=Marinilabilia rubra TaxID=2162893 RepID=A0A2U2BBG1_9BACT|nr:2-amino-4-hydroxy-6-hydroxymethyldihydropteridine diphosphokinase [Marinilabilia rubra]PWE00412.1 2-amino-4-hydroxy-6-hydroxymethyldihydropteridine diphosphokinase [Marinilabilia rubra]
MPKVVLLLGGNQEKTREVFDMSIEVIRKEVGSVIELSGVYKSPPWGFDDPNWFFNQVLIVETTSSPFEVLRKTQQIEKQMGRKKKTTLHYEGRLIDIDILFFGDEVVATSDLQIPHPRLHLRRFTLEPLNELMPDYLHPVFKTRVDVLLEQCPDNSKVFVES